MSGWEFILCILVILIFCVSYAKLENSIDKDLEEYESKMKAMDGYR